MNNVKIICFNPEAIDSIALNSALCSNSKYVGRVDIKPGLFLINFQGTAKELFQGVENIVGQNRIFIHDLDSGADAYWGIMGRDFWEWVKNNRQ